MDAPRRLIEQLCQENHVRLLYVFGSRAREMLAQVKDSKKSLSSGTSDVDIAILSDPALAVEQKVHLAQALEEVLGVERVDLVALGEADPFLAANIIRGERLYALDAYEADEYELYVLRRAGDLAELERERMALILHEEPPKYGAG
jgi:predicted nucleotidyltransferase